MLGYKIVYSVCDVDSCQGVSTLSDKVTCVGDDAVNSVSLKYIMIQNGYSNLGTRLQIQVQKVRLCNIFLSTLKHMIDHIQNIAYNMITASSIA